MMIQDLKTVCSKEVRLLNVEFDDMYSRIKEVYSDFSISKGLDFNKIFEIDNIQNIVVNRYYQYSFEFSIGSMERDYLTVWFDTGSDKIEFLSACVFKSEDSVLNIMQAMRVLVEREKAIID